MSDMEVDEEYIEEYLSGIKVSSLCKQMSTYNREKLSFSWTSAKHVLAPLN